MYQAFRSHESDLHFRSICLVRLNLRPMLDNQSYQRSRRPEWNRKWHLWLKESCASKIMLWQYCDALRTFFSAWVLVSSSIQFTCGRFPMNAFFISAIISSACTEKKSKPRHHRGLCTLGHTKKKTRFSKLKVILELNYSSCRSIK